MKFEIGCSDDVVIWGFGVLGGGNADQVGKVRMSKDEMEDNEGAREQLEENTIRLDN